MRTIKFRAWSIDRQMFVIDGMTIEDIQQDATQSLELPNIIASEKIVWQQYTGLNDKNGIEIYDGDILEHYKGVYYLVEWESVISGSWGARSINRRSYLPYFREAMNTIIVGNIFENPELLKR